MEISVVTTLYHSAEYIRLFHERMSQTLQGLCQNYEIILVNDGSPDHSLDVAVALQAEDPAVKVIDLSRNFGQHKAQMTGLAHTKGDLIFLIEIDLEGKPEWLTDFYQEMWQADQVDVIFGSQRSRKGRAFERWSGMLFYRLFNMLSEVKIPANHLTVRLMSSNHLPTGVNGLNPYVTHTKFGLDFAVIDDPIQAEAYSQGEYYWGGAAGTWFWIDPVENLVFIGMIQQFGAQLPDVRSTSKRLVYQAIMEPK